MKSKIITNLLKWTVSYDNYIVNDKHLLTIRVKGKIMYNTDNYKGVIR